MRRVTSVQSNMFNCRKAKKRKRTKIFCQAVARQWFIFSYLCNTPHKERVLALCFKKQNIPYPALNLYNCFTKYQGSGFSIVIFCGCLWIWDSKIEKVSVDSNIFSVDWLFFFVGRLQSGLSTGDLHHYLCLCTCQFQILEEINPSQTTSTGRGIVTSKVALLLHSAEKNGLFNRF